MYFFLNSGWFRWADLLCASVGVLNDDVAVGMLHTRVLQVIAPHALSSDVREVAVFPTHPLLASPANALVAVIDETT